MRTLLPNTTRSPTDPTKGLSLEAMDALFGAAPRDEEAFEKGKLGSVRNIRGNIEKDVSVEQVERDTLPRKD